jgi:hypothetical protein
MRTENDLIQKLMISKKIMDKHKEMPRGGVNESDVMMMSNPDVENFAPVPATYNIPTEFLQEQEISRPVNINPTPITEDKIRNSKLPDEIKRLMMEHPINQPQQTSTTLSDDLVAKATRLMGTEKQKVTEGKKPTGPLPKHIESPSIDKNEIASIVRETVEEVLRENGLLIESTQRTKDNFTFKVGNHIFEGKLTKIKKVS